MADRRKGFRFWLAAGGCALLALIAAAIWLWRDDILRTSLDPKTPYQIYHPPAAPDYAAAASWSLLPADPRGRSAADPPADIFFISPTTYDGGGEWNAPIGKRLMEQFFRRSIAPNYAGPFVRIGRVFAPRYRQASLYTLMTLREDAREARRFAYGDVAEAFRFYRDRYNQGRPFVIVGVEQGGTLAARLLAEEVAPDPQLRRRLAAAYLIETALPDGAPAIPPCLRPDQAGCVAAWVSDVRGDGPRNDDLIERALVWGADGELQNLEGRVPLCFNPILHAVTGRPAPVRLNLGAANATSLEWGVRPAFLTRQVSARCVDGVLKVSRPKSSLLRPAGSWTDRRKVPSYNLFWADLEADAKTRLAALPAEPAVSPGRPLSQLPRREVSPHP